MGTKKLKSGEIDETLKKIRLKYDTYIQRYDKSESLKWAFEQRYLEALTMRMDLGRFLQAEIDAVMELEEREVREIKKLKERKQAALLEAREKKDTARKVWEENNRRIQHYPEFDFDHEASHEISKLIGAMHWFEKEYWIPLDSLFRSSGSSRQANNRVAIEMRWRDFCVAGREGVPLRLAKYKSLLSRFPRDLNSLEWEERQLLFEAATFLGLVRDFLQEAMGDERYKIPARERIREGKDQLEEILLNFRLADLIRLSQKR